MLHAALDTVPKCANSEMGRGRSGKGEKTEEGADGERQAKRRVREREILARYKIQIYSQIFSFFLFSVFILFPFLFFIFD